VFRKSCSPNGIKHVTSSILIENSAAGTDKLGKKLIYTMSYLQKVSNKKCYCLSGKYTLSPYLYEMRKASN